MLLRKRRGMNTLLDEERAQLLDIGDLDDLHTLTSSAWTCLSIETRLLCFGDYDLALHFLILQLLRESRSLYC